MGVFSARHRPADGRFRWGMRTPGKNQRSRRRETRLGSLPDIPFTAYDPQAEQLLLDLANQARAQAGAPRLKARCRNEPGRSVHAEAMFAARQLSHQFDGEPSLPQRLAAATRIQLDQEGETSALDSGP